MTLLLDQFMNLQSSRGRPYGKASLFHPTNNDGNQLVTKDIRTRHLKLIDVTPITLIECNYLSNAFSSRNHSQVSVDVILPDGTAVAQESIVIFVCGHSSELIVLYFYLACV